MKIRTEFYKMLYKLIIRHFLDIYARFNIFFNFLQSFLILKIVTAIAKIQEVNKLKEIKVIEINLKYNSTA